MTLTYDRKCLEHTVLVGVHGSRPADPREPLATTLFRQELRLLALRCAHFRDFEEACIFAVAFHFPLFGLRTAAATDYRTVNHCRT